MSDTSRPRRHPFGRVANALVHLGTTLGLAQAVVFVLGRGAVALTQEGTSALTDLLSLALVVLFGGLPGWLCWRGLWSWRAQAVASLRWLVGGGLLMMPLGALLLPWGVLFTPAGVLLSGAALLARPRIVAAAEAQRADGTA